MFIKRPFTPRHSSQILELNTLLSHATKMEIPTLSEGQMAQTSCAELSDDNMVLAAPVVRQPKVGIKFNIKSTMMPMKTLDSSDSTTTEEESEFDKDAIVVPGPDQEARNTKKPRMKGKRFAEWPVINADKDQSSLCSIM